MHGCRAGRQPASAGFNLHLQLSADNGYFPELLTFARKQRLEPRRVNLNSLVVEFSEMLVRTLGVLVDLPLEL